MRRLNAGLLLLLFAANTDADWKLISAQSEPGAAKGIEHRYIVVENSLSGDRASLELAEFRMNSFRLRVIDQPAEPRLEVDEVMRRENCLAGVNGGYFHPGCEPIGLLVVDGRLIAPLQRARLLTGVLTASPRGIQIVRIGEFSRGRALDAAVQCGPFLVDLGVRVRGLDDTHTARRTFAAVDQSDHAALGFCSEVTLAELGKILTAKFANDFKIQRALNLDGGSSSAFWFARKDGSALSIPEQKTVRDFVAIVPR